MLSFNSLYCSDWFVAIILNKWLLATSISQQFKWLPFYIPLWFLLASYRLWVQLQALRAAEKAFAFLMVDGKLTTFWCSTSGGTAPYDLLPAPQFHMTGYPSFPMATFPLRWAQTRRQEEGERPRVSARCSWSLAVQGGASQRSLLIMRCVWSGRNLKPTCWRPAWR